MKNMIVTDKEQAAFDAVCAELGLSEKVAVVEHLTPTMNVYNFFAYRRVAHIRRCDLWSWVEVFDMDRGNTIKSVKVIPDL